MATGPDGAPAPPDEHRDAESAPTAPDTRPRSGRLLTLTGAVLLGVVLVGVVWVAVTAALARSRLQHVAADLPALRRALAAGDVPRATALTARIRRDAASAHSLTTGPAWWVSANLPLAGAPLRTARILAAAADDLGSTTLPALGDVLGALRSVRTAGRTAGLGAGLDVDLLARQLPALDHGAAGIDAARQALRAAPASTWLSPVDRARSQLLDRLAPLAADVATVRRSLPVALSMLGVNGPRRYFVAFENEAEMRGIGGIPGAFAIAVADHGRIRFTRFGTDVDLTHVRADIDLGPEYRALYAGANPTGYYINSDISPDFRDAAQIWAGMWQAKTGQHIDGAVAMDPTALRYLLAVTGPARLADGTQVPADRIVAVTQRDQYARPLSLADRKAYLVGLAKGVAARLVHSAADPLDLLHALTRAAGQRRLLMWSSRPGEEAVLAPSVVGGALIADGRPSTGFVVVNGAGSKLDYYLDRSMAYVRNGCGAGRTSATLRLHNGAPASGLPPYVTIRNDRPHHPTRPGDNHELVTYYATAGTRLVAATVDGRAAGSVSLPERGLVAINLGVEVPIGRTVTIRLDLAEPAVRGRVRVLRQPGVRAETVDVRRATCR